jgi:hypothetical protein
MVLVYVGFWIVSSLLIVISFAGYDKLIFYANWFAAMRIALRIFDLELVHEASPQRWLITFAMNSAGILYSVVTQLVYFKNDKMIHKFLNFILFCAMYASFGWSASRN